MLFLETACVPEHPFPEEGWRWPGRAGSEAILTCMLLQNEVSADSRTLASLKFSGSIQ